MLIDKNKCCGCASCVNACPKACISMIKDDEGFLYPHIDETICVDCGLCQKACPILNLINDVEKVPEAYAVRIIDTDLRLKSSSGGIFSALANFILLQKGVVCGAAFTADCKSVEHIIIDKQEELYKLRGAKYVQSTIGSIYKEILLVLNSGRKVLFSGTPCQISGLRAFLTKEYDNLLCVEVICHGVPSPDLFLKYIDAQEQKAGSKILRIDFRHKKFGWLNYRTYLEFTSHKVIGSALQDNPYMLMFLKDYCLRPSCYNCYFKNFKPRADFTIADFWGIQNTIPEFFDDKGISLVLIHNRKAQYVFETIKECIEYYKTDCMSAIKDNMSMLKSVVRPLERDFFFADMHNMDFTLLSKKYTPIPFKRRIKNCLKSNSCYAFLENLCKSLKNIIRAKK